MEYVLIQREGFKEEFLAQIELFLKMSSDELVDKYNRQVEIGIVGSYGQAVSLAALRNVFNRRFGQSPILLEENLIISLTDKIKIVDTLLRYLDNTNVPLC